MAKQAKPRLRAFVKSVPKKLSWKAKLMIKLFSRQSVCKYCGKRFKLLDAKKHKSVSSQENWYCPDGHEGYTVRQYGCVTGFVDLIHNFDNVNPKKHKIDT